MYPHEYDDSLKPIYLYRPEYDSSHVIFIRNINSFFKSNSYVCLACLRQFKRLRDSRSPHLCKKRTTCFVCRRFLQSDTTYLNYSLEKLFCDKLITKENSFICQICNCQIYSLKCFKGHKRLCKGQGYFGYKCNECNKFTYCQNNTSNEVKLKHVCCENTFCKFCFSVKEKDSHQCKLKFELAPKFLTRLAFFKFVTDENGSLLLAIFYREELERGLFQKYNFSYISDNRHTPPSENLKVSYIDEKWCLNEEFNNGCKIFESSTFFQRILSFRENLSGDFEIRILAFLLDEHFANTTYICEDSSGSNLVSTQNLLNYYL